MPRMSRTWADAAGFRHIEKQCPAPGNARDRALREVCRAKRAPYRYGLMRVLLNEPPWQPALEKPSTPTAMPHTLTGTLTGAFTLLPEPIAAVPALPLPLPPSAPLMTVLLAAPPLQWALAKPATDPATPHTLTGMLTGAFTLLPEPAEMTPALPLPLPPLPPLMTVLLAAPPSQPAFAPPSRATATPQTSTGALSGAFTLLPDSSDSTPALPLPLGPSANAAPAGSTNPAVSTAVLIAAEIQRAFFISLLLFRLAVD